MKTYRIIVVLFLALIISGCNSVKLKSVSDCKQTRADGEHIYTVQASGSFFNLENDNIKKDPHDITVGDQHFSVKDGADYVGIKNAKVVYSISYWDSVCAVFSFGFYVPVMIEYTPSKK
ncbi:MAG: hypothetical protein WC082_00100 [Victivallales bacterium]|jgi:PBP1b-binding outer membrane lipoprotein LpoB